MLHIKYCVYHPCWTQLEHMLNIHYLKDSFLYFCKEISFDRRYDIPLFIYWRFLEWPLKNYFPVMHRCGISTHLLPLTFFSCKSSIIYCKILIIAVVSDERTNELRIYAKLCRNVIIFYRQQLASLCQVQEKFRVCGTASLRMTVI